MDQVGGISRHGQLALGILRDGQPASLAPFHPASDYFTDTTAQSKPDTAATVQPASNHLGAD